MATTHMGSQGLDEDVVEVPQPASSDISSPSIPCSIISRLEAVLSEQVGAMDALVGSEVAELMNGTQNEEWSEMIKEFHDQLVEEFVVDVKGVDQDSF